MRSYDLTPLGDLAGGSRPTASERAAQARRAAAAARKAARRAHAAAVRRARAALRRRHRARASAGRIDVPGGLTFLTQLGRAMADNPPPAQDAPELARLAAAGVGPGRSPASSGLPTAVVDGVRDGVDAEARELPARTRAGVVSAALSSGGWYTPPPALTGNYGTDYDLRAQATVIGLGANTADEALYRTAYGDTTGAPLDGSHTYRIVFPAAPPARAFWSLTLYDLEGFLSRGSRGRYAVGSAPPAAGAQARRVDRGRRRRRRAA